MKRAYRVLSLLLLLWLPFTLAFGSSLHACASHKAPAPATKLPEHAMVMQHQHDHQSHHQQHQQMAHSQPADNHDHHSDSTCKHSPGQNCLCCGVCHIPASLPASINLISASPMNGVDFLWSANHYRSIALPPADRPPLFV